MFGEHGFDAGVRQIAARAGVSPALVIHHFGSKSGLQRACDDWVIDCISQIKSPVLTGVLTPRIGDHLAEHPELGPIMTYIITALRSGGDVAFAFFDRLSQLTLDLFASAVRAGTMRPTSDPEATAAAMVAWSIGAFLLEAQLARTLGGTDLKDAATYARYVRACADVLTHGVFIDAFFEATFNQQD